MQSSSARLLEQEPLEAWLCANVSGYKGPAAITKFEGGQSNPTFHLDAASGSYVLRRKPQGQVLASAHAIDREYRVMAALASVGFPVPQVVAYCEDTEVIGSAFYVMEFVQGRVFWDPRLPGFSRQERTALFRSVNDTIAHLHALNPAELGLGDYGRPENFLRRQVARWSKQYRASETDHIGAMESLIAFLNDNFPPEEESRLVHGDFRLDNIIVHPSEPRVVAVLDWELSTFGSPAADFAYHMTTWRLSPALLRGLEGEDLLALGIPDEPAYRALYMETTGRAEIENWEYYLAFAVFRIAAICQGIAKRALDGTASSPDAVAMGAKAGPLAEIGWNIARRLRA